MEDNNKRQTNKPNRKAIIQENLTERGHEARTIRRIVAVIAIILILVFGGTALGGYLYISSALKPLDPENTKSTDVEIPIGSSSTSIGEILEEKGIIKDSTVFKYYVKFNNISGFQAGNYQFSPSMTLKEITATLQTGKLVREAVFKMTIPEGLQIKEIAKIMAKHIDMSEEEIVEKLNDSKTIDKYMKLYPELLKEDILDSEIMNPLEGYLFPATYSFYEKNPSFDTVISVMLEQTMKVVTPYVNILEEKGMTIHELLTMASLIEEEATEQADRKNISSVFYNRIADGMILQTDPTVAYALGEHLEQTLYEHLDVDSPYNTYKYPGLPPGPIANSGTSSIEAALYPADTDYKYFLAEYGTGKVHYAKTLEEHNALKDKYITQKRNNQ